MRNWQIFLDLDSTLLCGESLDILARQKGVGEEVERMTAASMNGDIPLEDVLENKLAILSPSKADMEQLLLRLPPLLLEDAADVLARLTDAGHEVWMLTANFHCIADPLGEALEIPRHRIIANDLYFDDLGNYAGFNKNSPLAKTGGKAEVLQQYKNGWPTCFVSDGVSDLPVKEVVDLFVGFGGVVVRERVQQEAHAFINIPSLSPLIDILIKAENL